MPTASPFLTVEQTPATAVVEPKASVRFDLTLKNTGSETIRSLKAVVSVPAGFAFSENNQTSLEQTFSDLTPGQSVAAAYDVLVGAHTTANIYGVDVTVTAANHGAVSDTSSVNVRLPQTQGESADPTLRALDNGQTTGKVLGATLPETSDARKTISILAGSAFLLFLGAAFMAIASQKENKSS